MHDLALNLKMIWLTSSTASQSSILGMCAVSSVAVISTAGQPQLISNTVRVIDENGASATTKSQVSVGHSIYMATRY